jgi:hypothetical protein
MDDKSFRTPDVDARLLRLLFDQQVMAIQRCGGASRHGIVLLREFARLPGIKAQLVAPAYINRYIRPGDALHRQSFALDWPRRGVRFRALVAEPFFRLAAALSRPDIVHETGYMLPAKSRPQGSTVVTTLHDLLQHYPEFELKASVVWHGVDRTTRPWPRPPVLVRPSYSSAPVAATRTSPV